MASSSDERKDKKSSKKTKKSKSGDEKEKKRKKAKKDRKKKRSKGRHNFDSEEDEEELELVNTSLKAKNGSDHSHLDLEDARGKVQSNLLDLEDAQREPQESYIDDFKVKERSPKDAEKVSLKNSKKIKQSVNFGPTEVYRFDSLRSQREEEEQALSEDVYSLMYTSRVKSHSFVFACVVFLIQNTVLWLIFYDLSVGDSDSNFIQIPPGVPVMVTVAQGLGVMLIVMTVTANGDLTNGISRLANGYNEVVLTSHPAARRIKWFLSGAFQAAVGERRQKGPQTQFPPRKDLSQ